MDLKLMSSQSQSLCHSVIIVLYLKCWIWNFIHVNPNPITNTFICASGGTLIHLPDKIQGAIYNMFVFISNDIKMIWHMGIYIYNIHTVQVIQHVFLFAGFFTYDCGCLALVVTAVLLNSYITSLNRTIQPGILLMHFSMWHRWSVTEHTHAWFHHFAFTHFQSELQSVMLCWWQYVVLLCVRYRGGVKEQGSSIRHVGAPVTCLLWSMADHTDQFTIILLLSLHCCLHLSKPLP